MSVLLIAEHNNKELKAFTLNAVTAASQIDNDVHALVIGNSCGDAANAASESMATQVKISSTGVDVQNELGGTISSFSTSAKFSGFRGI